MASEFYTNQKLRRSTRSPFSAFMQQRRAKIEQENLRRQEFEQATQGERLKEERGEFFKQETETRAARFKAAEAATAHERLMELEKLRQSGRVAGSKKAPAKTPSAPVFTEDDPLGVLPRNLP